MKLFKQIEIATENDIRQYINDDRLIRLSNTLVIDTDEKFLFVKYNNDIISGSNKSKICDALYDKDFVTVCAHKKLDPVRLLNLYDKNIRVVGNPAETYGKRIFISRVLNSDKISNIY